MGFVADRNVSPELFDYAPVLEHLQPVSEIRGVNNQLPPGFEKALRGSEDLERAVIVDVLRHVEQQHVVESCPVSVGGRKLLGRNLFVPQVVELPSVADRPRSGDRRC